MLNLNAVFRSCLSTVAVNLQTCNLLHSVYFADLLKLGRHFCIPDLLVVDLYRYFMYQMATINTVLNTLSTVTKHNKALIPKTTYLSDRDYIMRILYKNCY